jgi:thiol:disulfide interchange protein DsbC
MKTKKLPVLLVAAFVGAMFSQAASAVDLPAKEAAVLATLQQKYPKTVFKSVTRTPMPGVYEVVMGKNVAYVEEGGRFFVFGHLFDMYSQTDLTAERIQAEGVGKIDFGALPAKDAIVVVRGDGSRKLAIFSDPDCPFCRQLETNLAGLNDVTIYLYMFPIDQLHPQAKAKTVGVWCAKDRVRAWEDLVRRNVVLPGQCEHPVDRNVALAESLGISGTPTIILSDGTLVPGAVSLERLEQQLQTLATVAKK